jgi:hypothetical protein
VAGQHTSAAAGEQAHAVTPVASPRDSRGRPRLAVRSKLVAGGLVLAAAVAAVLVLFGSTNSQVTDPIAQAATRSSSTPGYRMKLVMTINTPALSRPIVASGNAIVDLRDQAVSMSFAMDFSQLPQATQALGSTTLRLGMIFNRGVIYMKLPARLAAAVPSFGGKQWVEVNVAKMTGVPGLSSFGSNPSMSDPSHILQYLRANSDSVTNEGPQLVDGLQTTHYRVALDLDRLAAAVPSSKQALVQRALSQLEQSTGVHQIPADVWIDAHHLVRRIALTISGPGGATALQETADLSDYGPQPRPTPPPADQVQDLSSLIHAGG